MRLDGLYPFGVVAAAALAIALPGAAQVRVPDNSAPRFEVVSVRPIGSGGAWARVREMPDRFTISGATVQQLILTAYDVQPYQVRGAPGWLTTERFDIVAKAAASVSRPEMHLMLRMLLAERFGLDMRSEARQTDIYAMVRARSDGNLGPKLRPSPLNCESLGGSDLRVSGDTDRPQSRIGCRASFGSGQMHMTGQSLRELTRFLSGRLGRPVIDQTGLTGSFDWDLGWADEGPAAVSGDRRAADAEIGTESGASLFTALREQLGLTLRSTRGRVDVFVIRTVRRPSAN